MNYIKLDDIIHACRGASGSYIAITVALNVLHNGGILLRKRLHSSHRYKWIKPSRNILAIVIFIGVFRIVFRFQSAYKQNRRIQQNSTRLLQNINVSPCQKAAIVASSVAILYMDPTKRSTVISFVSTNAASMLFKNMILRHKEIGHSLRYLDVLVYMLSCGWIVHAGFFCPNSYDPSHLHLLMKYTHISPQSLKYLQNKYTNGINYPSCKARHPGLSCSQFIFNGEFAIQVTKIALGAYIPVHGTKYLFSILFRYYKRQPNVQVAMILRKFVIALTRSSLFMILYVLGGWSTLCLTKQVGLISLTARRLQLAFSGAIPSAALLCESPSRRNSIAVILCSYAFVSMSGVLGTHIKWLQRTNVVGQKRRTFIDILLTGASVGYTLEGMIRNNSVLHRVLLGSSCALPKNEQNDIQVETDNHQNEDIRSETTESDSPESEPNVSVDELLPEYIIY